MRSFTITMALLATTVASTQAISQTSHDNFSVELNKTKVLRLPQAASAVLVGNPDIADVSVHSADTLFLVGRGFGETNLIILDANGNEMMDANLTVVHTLPNHGIRLYNAKSRETYSCIPYCQPSPVLGDAPDFIGGNSNTQAALRNTRASANTGDNADANGSSDLVGGGSGGGTGASTPVDNDGSNGFGSGF